MFYLDPEKVYNQDQEKGINKDSEKVLTQEPEKKLYLDPEKVLKQDPEKVLKQNPDKDKTLVYLLMVQVKWITQEKKDSYKILREFVNMKI